LSFLAAFFNAALRLLLVDKTVEKSFLTNGKLKIVQSPLRTVTCVSDLTPPLIIRFVFARIHLPEALESPPQEHLPVMLPLAAGAS
jgi:hypothetical protein